MTRSNPIIAGLALAMLAPALALAGQAPAPAAGQAQAPRPANNQPAAQATQRPMVSCQRGGLQYAVRLYLEAQAKGDTSVTAARHRSRLPRKT